MNNCLQGREWKQCLIYLIKNQPYKIYCCPKKDFMTHVKVKDWMSVRIAQFLDR